MSILSALLKKPISLLESKINAAKNQAKAEMAVLLAKMIVVLVIALILFIAIAIASAGLAMFINYKISHPYIGYFYVGSGYLIVAIILIILSKTDAFRSGIESMMKKQVNKERKK